ncbi:MAG: hypothetical protein II309_08245 [Bacilli bacterium]|nr:hypothetical protein [Bacilli bacterium]
MDLVVFLVLCGLVVFFFKRFSSFIYFVAMTDIFLRIVTFIKVEITKGDIYAILDKYIPNNIPSILDAYADGLLLKIFIWLYVIAFIIFETYIIRTFFRKK